MLVFSTGALACVAVWSFANAHASLSSNVAIVLNPNLGKISSGGAGPCPQRLCLKQQEQGTRPAAASRRSSLAPDASLSRGQFLGSFLASSAATMVCIQGASASGPQAGSARDNIPDKQTTAAPGNQEGTSESSSGTQAAAYAGQDLHQVLLTASESESAASSALSGLVAGAAVSVSKQLLLHPVDTVKTRLQLRRGEASGELFRGLYDGVLPPLLAGLPSGALFFSAKDAFSTGIGNVSGGQFPDLTTVAAVGLAQFPYWGIRTPAELLKIRSQAGKATTTGGGLEQAKMIVADEGVKGLYTGYSSNIAYAFPADAIKFLVYGSLKRSAKKAKGGVKLSTLEAAVLGSGASLAAQAVTTPLDVVRTRVMTAAPSDEGYKGGVVGALGSISREEGFSALWAGITPRVARSVLSGAIQFGSYEFVKGLFGVEPRKL